MLGNRKYVLNSYNAIDYMVLQEILEKKARNGYLIDKYKFGVIRFRKTEPKELDFSIGVYPKAKSYEGVDDSEARIYIKAQEEKGWTYAASIQNLQVFYKEKGLDIPDIDKIYQIENIRSSLKLETVSYIILGALNLFNMRSLFPLEIYRFYSNVGLFGIILLPLITFFFLYSSIANIYHIIRLKKLDDETDITYRNLSLAKVKRRISSFIGFFVFFTLIGTLILDSGMKNSLVLMTLIPLGFAFFVGFRLRDFFKGRDLDPFLKTFIMVILVFITVFASSNLTIRYYDRINSDGMVPDDVFGLKFEDLGYIIDANHTEYYDQQGSLLMPKYYSYSEYIGYQRLVTEVMVGRNENLTDYFLKKRLERMTRYYSVYWDARDFYPDYEQAFFITSIKGDAKEGGTLLIKERDSIVMFTLDKDLTHEGIIAIINEKMKDLPENW